MLSHRVVAAAAKTTFQPHLLSYNRLSAFPLFGRSPTDRHNMSTLPLHTHPARLFQHNRFVYPVLSRRSGGISIGVNLNPDKICNFDCIYCQVDRRSEAETAFVETDRLLAELDAMFRLVASGELYRDVKFSQVPPPLRRLNDVAF